MTNHLRRFLIALIFPVIGIFAPLSATAQTTTVKIGIVIMHGKGGSPTRLVSDLVSSLESQGFLVANLEMPWSGRRNYDVDVSAGVAEVEAALSSLRGKGAQKLFIAGHSQGGLFALYLGGRLPVNGIIAIAPGGDVSGQIFKEKIGDSLELARKMVAEGKGQETVKLSDYEGSKGTYPVVAKPATYLTWFDPEGAMNEAKAVRNMNPSVAVLFIGPTNDYPALIRLKQPMFAALPKNPGTRLYEPNSSHLNAPSASIKEIFEWTTAIASAP